MLFPDYRPRRLRQSNAFRRMIQETSLSTNDLILPLFAINGKNIKNQIKEMPGQYHLSIDNLIRQAKQAFSVGIPAIMLFGIPSKKNTNGTRAYAQDGIVQRAISELKDQVPDLAVITDVCLCQYTNHGHCGFVNGDLIDNDATLDLVAKTALSHAQAGADMVAPSGMMDGHVSEIRRVLDENSLNHVPIMSYSAKYCSDYYGPFRQAVHSAPNFGDRRSYQMDPANSRESIREALMDVDEGADIIMIKPALAYMDIIYRIRQTIELPVAAYNVSGEYSMIKAADKMGWINGKKVMMETLTAIKRSGADIILTYFALEAAKVINQ
jgi:porphobilinogen synthase